MTTKLSRGEITAQHTLTTDTMRLTLANAHPRDSGVLFSEEAHLYWCRLGAGDEFTPIKQSVSGFVGHFFPGFDADLVLKRMQSSRRWPQSKYYPRSAASIKEEWARNGAEASRLGTHMHAVIERALNGVEPPPEDAALPEMAQYRAFMSEWVAPRHLSPYRTEWRLYGDEAFPLSGTADLLCVCLPVPEGDELPLALLDHKRSRKIDTTDGFERANGVCSDLPATNFSKYALALNVYKHLLETYYRGFVYEGRTYERARVTLMALDVFHPEHEGYEVYEVPCMQNYVQRMRDELHK